MMVLNRIKSILEGIYFVTVWKATPAKRRKERLGIDKSKYSNKISQIELAIITKYSSSQYGEKHKIAEYIKKYGLTGVFPYEFCYKYYLKTAVSLGWDKRNKLYYIRRKGKKIYLKQDNYREAFLYAKNLLMEQDKNSPHRYVENEKILNGEYLFDCGAAEGILSLDHIEKFKQIYLFEADESWIKALKLSFKPYEDKVMIVNKYLAQQNDGMNITMDKFMEQQNINLDSPMFIKIDVEGAEEDVLKGAQKVLERSSNIRLAVCTYHRENDDISLYKLLEQYPGMKLEFSRGYMVLYYDEGVSENIPEAYMRRGVLCAERRRG